MSLLSKPNFLAFLALLILSIPATNSLTAFGLYTSHDGETHTVRIAQYYQALIDGQFPPRFASSLYSGLGSPIFVYIYPAPYLIGSLLHLGGVNFADSFKLIMALSFFLSGIFTYLWLNEFFISPKAAFGGALLYIFVPYRFLLVYVRGSISEMLAYTFVPLSLFFFTKLIKTHKLQFVPLSALGVGAILLSQNLVALLSMPVICVYILLLAFSHRPIKSLFLSILAICWGVIISAITYLPAFKERGFIHFDSSINNAYLGHFVTLKQLIYSPWGYGFDMPGTLNDQMSFQVGLAQILVVLISICLILSRITKLNFIKKYTNKLNTFEALLTALFLLIFFVSIVFMLDIPFTGALWSKYRALTIIDIPWRLLGITSLAVAFLGAAVIKTIKQGAFFVFIVLLVIIANRNHMRINQPRVLTDDFFLNYPDTATQYSEFTPKWRQTEKVPLFFDPKTKYEITSGTGNVNVLNSSSKSITLETDIRTPSAKMLINKFYFPGVSIIENNRKLEPFRDYQISNPASSDLSNQKDRSGLPEIILPQGKSIISFQYGETSLRMIADLISLISTFLALLAIIFLTKPFSKLIKK